jgi:hypothetical protein
MLIDKFNCIDNNIRDDKIILDTLENYFENYFQNNNKVLLYDYILQILNFNPSIIHSDELHKIIINQMKEYISSVRNNMRVSIKKNLFNLNSGLNKFLIDFKTKIDFIVSFVNSHISYTEINNLLDIIINDIYIKNCIEINIDNHDDISQIYTTLKKYNSMIQSRFIEILGDIHKKNLITKSDYPIPANLKRLYDFNKTLINVNKIVSVYTTMNGFHINLITKYLYEAVVIEFKEILKNNNLNEINLFIKNNKQTLLSILRHHEIKSVFCIKKDFLIKLNDFVIDDLKNNVLDITDIIHIMDLIKRLLNHVESKITYTVFIKKIANIQEINNKLFALLESNLAKYKEDGTFYTCKTFIDIMIHTDNKDEFISLYYKNLLKRLLHHFNKMSYNEFKEYVHFETALFNEIKFIMGIALTYSIKKLIDDFVESRRLKFNMSGQFPFPVNTPLLSYNNEINMKDGTISSAVLSEYKTNMTKILNGINNNMIKSHGSRTDKSILWLPHFGEVNIVYLDISIRLLPIQMLILELFDKSDFIFESELNTLPYLKNYSAEFKIKLLESFVKGKLLIRLNNTYILNTKPNFSNDFITIFHSLSNMNQIWKEQKKQDLIHSRHEIVIANINSLLKTNKYNYHDITQKLKSLNNLFIIDDKIIDDSLKIMLDKDYIRLNFYFKIKKIILDD